MPIEVKDKEKFIEISSRAQECRVVKDEKKGIAKVKARTKRYLYTIKIPLDELTDFLKKVKCSKIVEIGKGGVKKEISISG
ncbi:MAG TPA: 5'-nucleotidase [Acidilobales archaeon]|nr:5'-nucleotidase [Acidilobales archaeon]